jgi:hypothetical protein
MAMPKMPQFETEAEEAQWWFDHRDDLSDEFVRRAAEGTLGEGSLARFARRRRELDEAKTQAPELSGLRAK